MSSAPWQGESTTDGSLSQFISCSPVNCPEMQGIMTDEARMIFHMNKLTDMVRMSQGSLPTSEYRQRISPNKKIDIPAIENRSRAVSWMKEVCDNDFSYFLLTFTFICYLTSISLISASLFTN